MQPMDWRQRLSETRISCRRRMRLGARLKRAIVRSPLMNTDETRIQIICLDRCKSVAKLGKARSGGFQAAENYHSRRPGDRPSLNGPVFLLRRRLTSIAIFRQL